MKVYRYITVGTVVSLLLAGCSSDTTAPAPITAITNDSGGYSAAPTSKSGTVDSSPSTTTAIDTSRPNIVYTQGQSAASTASPAGQTVPTTPAKTNNNQTSSANTGDSRIVYNRSYSDIPKGSYNGGATYTVSRGDTLFYIAWITGNDFRELAQKNSIAEPYSLSAGQVLNVGGGANTTTPSNGGMLAGTSGNGAAVSPSGSNQNQPATVDSSKSDEYAVTTGKQNVDKTLPATAGTSTASTSATTGVSTVPVATTSSSTSGVRWRWPTEGKVIDNFSTSDGGNKGIDIAGSRGQSVLAAADGRIVYAGNALRGYGNLIIIKHNDDYLSAYAHNDSMLVAEQQDVKAGQKIATMGSTGASSVRLHFEIRYKGKSVNPLQHLPQR